MLIIFFKIWKVLVTFSFLLWEAEIFWCCWNEFAQFPSSMTGNSTSYQIQQWIKQTYFTLKKQKLWQGHNFWIWSIPLLRKICVCVCVCVCIYIHISSNKMGMTEIKLLYFLSWYLWFFLKETNNKNQQLCYKCQFVETLPQWLPH